MEPRWMIVELMGHRQIAGLVSEVQRFGVTLCRVEVPAQEPGRMRFAQEYGGAAIYCTTEVSEDFARRAAANIYRQPFEEPPAPALPERGETDRDPLFRAEDDRELAAVDDEDRLP